ncbi:MAG TPA: hypothetical protein VGK73_24305 [Polyangiaceae bacterium]
MSETSKRRDRLEETLNWVSDQDLQWWPFLFLRPAQHETMSSRRVAMVAALIGTFAGMLANVAIALTSVRAAARLSLFGLPAWLTMPVATTLLFFVFFRATFAASWNRRARRLPVRARERLP